MELKRIAKNSIWRAAFFLAGLNACQTPITYKEIGKNRVNPKAMTQINLMKENSKDFINNCNYKCIGKDTVEVTPDVYKNYDEYIAKLNKIALEKNKNLHYDNIKTVLNSDKLYTNSGLDVYIPVEYYGKSKAKTF